MASHSGEKYLVSILANGAPFSFLKTPHTENHQPPGVGKPPQSPRLTTPLPYLAASQIESAHP